MAAVMNPGTVHIVGAGLAGLAAAVHLTSGGRHVELYEAGAHAGGRCRSYFDRDLDCRVDNGNHLLLSCNGAALFYLQMIGAERSLHAPKESVFPFMDVQTGKRWRVRISDSKFPWWIFQPNNRVPDTAPVDYIRDITRLRRAPAFATVADVLDKKSLLYKRFWTPLTVAIMNTQPEEASARLFDRVVREGMADGGEGMRPLTVKEGLSESFVDPALNFIQARGANVHFGKRLKKLEKAEGEIRKLVFADGEIAIQKFDWVVLALPAWSIAEIMPEYPAPNEFRSIVNAHFRVSVPVSPMRIQGLIGGVADWVFEKEGIVSTTTSAAEHVVDADAEELATLLWKDVAKLYALDEKNRPPCRVVKEKRATFAATPDQVIRRPKIEPRHANLVVCGDWTATKLPSTIEGAIRSGRDAARAILPPSEIELPSRSWA
jgi:squalene-associated FAD-dependent desaturase